MGVTRGSGLLSAWAADAGRRSQCSYLLHVDAVEALARRLLLLVEAQHRLDAVRVHAIVVDEAADQRPVLALWQPHRRSSLIDW